MINTLSHKFPARRLWRSAVLMFAIVGLLGCGGEEKPLPAAKPLTAELSALQRIPFYLDGQYPVKLIDPILMQHEDGRELQMRVLMPMQLANASGDGDIREIEQPKSTVPLLVFSHGNWSDRQKYDNVLLHWAAHGYVVVAPTHVDGTSMARGIFNSLRYGQMGLIEKRIDDVQLILDQLSALEDNLDIKINRDQIGLTGHSFGAFTAQQMIGAEAFEESITVTGIDKRVKAVVAMSPPGPMFDLITAESWRKVSEPMLVSTGTWDIEPTFFPEWQLHKMSFDNASGLNQFAMVFEGADHYFGNLICRPERPGPPQSDALNLFNAYSTLFLDAFVKGNEASKQYLESEKITEITGDFIQWSKR